MVMIFYRVYQRVLFLLCVELIVWVFFRTVSFGALVACEWHILVMSVRGLIFEPLHNKSNDFGFSLSERLGLISTFPVHLMGS